MLLKIIVHTVIPLPRAQHKGYQISGLCNECWADAAACGASGHTSLDMTALHVHHGPLTVLPGFNEHVCLSSAGLQRGSAGWMEAADAES